MKFCEEDVLSILISTINSLSDSPKLQVLNALKNISSHQHLQNKLENSGFVVDIVKLIKSEKKIEGKIACVLILNNICKFSPARQEQAALAGVIPELILGLECTGLYQQICLSLLCSIVSASVACRNLLNKSNGLNSLVNILSYNLIGRKGSMGQS